MTQGGPPRISQIFWSQSETDKLTLCPKYTNDGIHSDYGYLDTWEIPGGPP